MQEDGNNERRADVEALDALISVTFSSIQEDEEGGDVVKMQGSKFRKFVKTLWANWRTDFSPAIATFRSLAKTFDACSTFKRSSSTCNYSRRGSAKRG